MYLYTTVFDCTCTVLTVCNIFVKFSLIAFAQKIACVVG